MRTIRKIDCLNTPIVELCPSALQGQTLIALVERSQPKILA